MHFREAQHGVQSEDPGHRPGLGPSTGTRRAATNPGATWETLQGELKITAATRAPHQGQQSREVMALSATRAARLGHRHRSWADSVDRRQSSPAGRRRMPSCTHCRTLVACCQRASPLSPDAGGLAVPTGASARLLLPGAGDVVAAARVEGEQPFLHQQAERLRGRLPRGPVPGDQVRDRRGRLPVRDLAAGMRPRTSFAICRYRRGSLRSARRLELDGRAAPVSHVCVRFHVEGAGGGSACSAGASGVVAAAMSRSHVVPSHVRYWPVVQPRVSRMSR
jgi:hypothetical protein